MQFEDLTEVHARRHAQRIQDHFDRRTVRQKRHVFFRQNAADNTFITVPSGHLVAHRQAALDGHVHLDQFQHAGLQFVAAFQLADFAIQIHFQHTLFLVERVRRHARLAARGRMHFDLVQVHRLIDRDHVFVGCALCDFIALAGFGVDQLAVDDVL